MIYAYENESFYLSVSLEDPLYAQTLSGHDVNYDIRKQPGDLVLNPPLSGILTESIFDGIYNAELSIDNVGSYIAYINCDGFYSISEYISIKENLSELIKQNRHYNISVEEVVRLNDVPNQSQILRKVAINRTDYIITKIKSDVENDWNSASENRVYAWYKNSGDVVPFKMGGSS